MVTGTGSGKSGQAGHQAGRVGCRVGMGEAGEEQGRSLVTRAAAACGAHEEGLTEGSFETQPVTDWV